MQIFSIVLFLTVFFIHRQPVSAVASEPDAIKIQNGVNNETLINTYESQAKPTPGTGYQLSIPSVEVSTEKFQIPKLDDVADWLTNVLPFMNAKSITEKTIPHQNNLYISGQARRCIYRSGEVVEQVGETYKTDVVEYLSKLMTATELLSAQTVRNVISPKNGSYDFRGPSYEVDEAPPCDAVGDGTPQEAKQVTLAQGFSLSDWFKSLFQKFSAKTVLVSKQLCPECERISCILPGCVKQSVDLDYIKNEKKQKTLKQSGGIVDAGFRTNSMDTTKGENPNGQEENFTKTNTFATKQMENSANLIKCMLVPKDKRSTIGLTEEDCNGFVKEPPMSCQEILKKSTFNPSQYSSFGSSNDATLGFSIPMHKTSCKITNLEAVATFAKQWANKQEGYDNVMKYYKTIEEYAVKAGWNPAFLVALWIEETAAGSVGKQEMGCVYDFGKPGSADPSVCGQLSCIFNYPIRNSTYDFLCSYGGKGGVGCTTFYINAANDNRCFPSNLRGSYQKVVSLGGVNSACAPTGRTSEHFRQDCEAKVPGGSIFDK